MKVCVWPKSFPLIISWFLGILVLQGCENRISKPTPVTQAPSLKPAITPEKKPRYKVALLIPLSGDHRALGESLQQAAELSLFENADEDLEILIRDTGGTPAGAKEAGQSAIQEGAQLILGPVFASEVRELKPLAQSHKIPVLCFSNDFSVAQPGIFPLGFQPQDQVRRVITYAQSHHQGTIGAFIPHSPYGQLLSEALKRLHQKGEISHLSLFFYKPEDLQTLQAPQALTEVKSLFFGERGENLSHLLLTLKKNEISINTYQLLGTGLWDDPESLKNPDLQGAWFAAPDPQERQEFEKRIMKFYGKKPLRLATLAYDALSLAAVLAKTKEARPFTLTQLTQRRGFAGIDGIFRLLPTGALERSLAILEITPTGFKVLDPDLTQFKE